MMRRGGRNVNMRSLPACLIALIGVTVQAREMGHYGAGLINIRDLAVPATAGFYYEQYNAYYTTDTYRDRHGDRVDSVEIGSERIEIDTDIDSYVIVPQFLWVTDRQWLGGDYAFYIAPSVVRNSVATRLTFLDKSVDSKSDGTGLGDLYIQPLWLGWRDSDYDLSVGAGVYLPTGRYDAGEDDNTGLGFWTAQLQAAAYYYLDEQQSSALMISSTYETHGEKDGTDVTPGDHVTLEWGYSQYLSQRLEIGVSGFGLWQIERDDRPASRIDPNAKSEVYGIGGQLAYWATPRVNLSLRYVKEFEAKARFEGEWLTFNITWLPFPLF